jgi:hypothetical protein
LYVPAAQAQDIIEKVTETQDSTADSLRTSSALSTISSDAVEIKTKNTQPSVEQGNQERNKDLACNNKNFTSSIGGGFCPTLHLREKTKHPAIMLLSNQTV